MIAVAGVPSPHWLLPVHYEIDDVIEIRDPNTRRRTWYTIDMVRHRGADGKQHYYSSKPPLLPTLVHGGLYCDSSRDGGDADERSVLGGPLHVGDRQFDTTARLVVVDAALVGARAAQSVGDNRAMFVYGMGDLPDHLRNHTQQSLARRPLGRTVSVVHRSHCAA